MAVLRNVLPFASWACVAAIVPLAFQSFAVYVPSGRVLFITQSHESYSYVVTCPRAFVIATSRLLASYPKRVVRMSAPLPSVVEARLSLAS